MSELPAKVRVNVAEAAFVEWAESEGWRVSKRGWPDFMCYRGEEIMAVEVKWSDGLSDAQREVCDVLRLHGIPTFTWSPPGPLWPLTDDLLRPSDAYAIAVQRDQLAAENFELHERVAELEKALGERYGSTILRSDLTYLIRLTERLRKRPARLLALYKRYPEIHRPRRLGLRTESLEDVA